MWPHLLPHPSACPECRAAHSRPHAVRELGAPVRASVPGLIAFSALGVASSLSVPVKVSDVR